MRVFRSWWNCPSRGVTRTISATSENTSDINPWFYEDPLWLLINNIEGKITEFLNAWNCNNRWLRTLFSYSSKFACKFLSFAHFLKTLFHHSVLFFLFSFSLRLPLNSSIYSLSTILKRDANVTEKQILNWISCFSATWGPIVSN